MRLLFLLATAASARDCDGGDVPTVATDAFACNRHRSVESPGTAFRVGVSIPVNFGAAAAPAQLRGDSPAPDTAADAAAADDVSGETKAPKPSGASLTLLDTIGAHTLFRSTKAAVMQVGNPATVNRPGGSGLGGRGSGLHCNVGHVLEPLRPLTHLLFINRPCPHFCVNATGEAAHPERGASRHGGSPADGSAVLRP